MADEPSSFLARLKRHHIFRVASVYAIAAWVLMQLANSVFPNLGWLRQSVLILIVMLLLLFPVVLILSWMLIPPSKENPEKFTRWQHLRWRLGSILTLVIVVLVVISGGFLWHAHTRHLKAEAIAAARATPVTSAPSAATVIPAKSIAVLPLVNENGDKDQQYFSDGLSEDLINALSQFAGLKVISRNSSFQFRNTTDDSRTIGEKLGVAHLLEGSVQRAGDMVRISAELVNAADGSTLWSQRYDRPYKDLFALQDDITNAVAGELKAKLLENNGAVPQSDRPPSGNLDAWNAFSRGAYYMRFNTEADYHKAIDYFTQAIALDPRYAYAYAGVAASWTFIGAGFLGGEEQRQTYVKARVAADQALQLDPDLAAGHDARGLLLEWVGFDWTGAEAEYRHALALAPNDGLSKFRLGSLYSALGQPQQAIALIRQAIAGDPRNGGSYYWLAWNLAAVGQLEDAERAARKVIELEPNSPISYAGLVMIRAQRDNAKAALATAQQASAGPWRDFALAFALQVGSDRTAADAALKVLIAKNAGAMAYQIAEVYGLRKDPDNMFAWLDRAWANRDPGIQRLLTDPFILGYQNDPRFAAFCKKVGLPATTEARAPADSAAHD